MKNRTFITERDRYYIETSLKEKIKVKDIAKVLHKTPSCIYREIKRGTVEMLNSDLSKKKEYCADYSQARYEELKKNHSLRAVATSCSQVLEEMLQNGLHQDAVIEDRIKLHLI